jgi:hypothetical protein
LSPYKRGVGSFRSSSRNASPPEKQLLVQRTAGAHVRARRCQSEAPSRHTNHQRLGRAAADYGRLADQDYKMCENNKENQLLLFLPTSDPEFDKEKHFQS